MSNPFSNVDEFSYTLKEGVSKEEGKMWLQKIWGKNSHASVVEKDANKLEIVFSSSCREGGCEMCELYEEDDDDSVGECETCGKPATHAASWGKVYCGMLCDFHFVHEKHDGNMTPEKEEEEEDCCDHCQGEMLRAFPSGGEDRICEKCYTHYCRPQDKDESWEDYCGRHPNKQELYDEEAFNGICNRCKEPWGTGDWCKTVHNHARFDEEENDILICCKCHCKEVDSHCPDAWEYNEKEEEEEEKWWEVEVDLDDKKYASFLVFAATEEQARDEIADNEPQDYPNKYNQMNLSANEYTGKTDHLDTSMYHKLDD